MPSSLYDLVLDLGWECQRMSSCGVKTYEILLHIVESEFATEEQVKRTNELKGEDKDV